MTEVPIVSGLRSSAPGLVITAVPPIITTVSSTNTPSGHSGAAGTSTVSQPASVSARV